MADWTETGLCLGARRFGETGAILDVLTASRGRSRGMVHGGASRSKRALLQPGNALHLTWRGGEGSLGAFVVVEAESERAARLMNDPEGLAALAALCAVLMDCLPEGEARPGLYEATSTLLDALADPEIWPALFVRYELGLLSLMGYGLDLSACALTGANDGLTHVSPRTGRAVKGSEAEAYLDRLLALPQFLLDPRTPVTPLALAQGFALSGHFLERRLFADLNLPVPEARALMVDRLIRTGRIAPLAAPAG